MNSGLIIKTVRCYPEFHLDDTTIELYNNPLQYEMYSMGTHGCFYEEVYLDYCESEKLRLGHPNL